MMKWILIQRILARSVLVIALSGPIPCREAHGSEQILKSFTFQTDVAYYPAGGLVQGPDGTLYGVTKFSIPGDGTVFKLNPDASEFGLLHVFGTNANDAANAIGPLLLADGFLYGLSVRGGTNGAGALFRLSTSGTDYQVLYSFSGTPDNAAWPQAPLVRGTNGALYGTTYWGGNGNLGIVFRINQDGSGYTILHNFEGSSTGTSNDGLNPQALMVGADGLLYGTTTGGGTNQNAAGGGAVFRLNEDGTGFTQLHSFPDGPTDGTSPQAGLLQGIDGTLFGTTTAGGLANSGIIYRLSPNGTGYQMLHSFEYMALLPIAQSALVQGSDGQLYGTTIQSQAGPGSLFSIKSDGTDFTLVHAFGSYIGDGLGPQGPLCVGTDGSLYGTTSSGGSREIGFGGTVFRVTSLPASPFTTSIGRAGDGGFNITFQGIVGAAYRLDVSTDLSYWSSLGTVLNETGQVQFLDVTGTNTSQRFYRAVLLP